MDYFSAGNQHVDLDAVSIHGDDELDDIDKEIKGINESEAKANAKAVTPSKGTATSKGATASKAPPAKTTPAAKSKPAAKGTSATKTTPAKKGKYSPTSVKWPPLVL